MTLSGFLALEEDDEAAARMAGRWQPRHEEHRRVGIVRRRVTPELISAVMSELGRRGAQSRRQRREQRPSVTRRPGTNHPSHD